MAGCSTPIIEGELTDAPRHISTPNDHVGVLADQAALPVMEIWENPRGDPDSGQDWTNWSVGTGDPGRSDWEDASRAEEPTHDPALP